MTDTDQTEPNQEAMQFRANPEARTVDAAVGKGVGDVALENSMESTLVVAETVLPTDIAANIMAGSSEGIDQGVASFISRLPNVADNGGRHSSGSTPGGTALGSPEARRQLLDNPEGVISAATQRLAEIIEKSRDPSQKALATVKNAADVKSGRTFWTIGDFIHSTNAAAVVGILDTGLLASEFHGPGSKTDTTPLAADFSEIVETITSTRQAIGKEQSTYAADRGNAGAILIKFRRDSDATDYGEDSSGNLDESPAHRTVFVGAPSSEISGIQLTNDNPNINHIIDSVVNNGQYIPVYSEAGEVIFTPEEFAIRTGIEIPAATTADKTPAIRKTENQVLGIAANLLSAAEESGAFRGEFSDIVRFSNRKYNIAVRAPHGLIQMNSPTAYGAIEQDKLKKVSVELDNNEVLHVWEKQDGELDMFTSSLEGPAKPVTDENVEEIRSRLAAKFGAIRGGLSTKRHAVKEEKKRLEAELEDRPVRRG